MGILKICLIGCFFMLLNISSCKTSSEIAAREVSFVHLDNVPGNYLVDNIVISDDSLKEKISDFVLKDISKIIKNKNLNNYYYEGEFYFSRDFYIKNKNTSYFINHEEDPGGWSSYELDNYKKDRIAIFHATIDKEDSRIIGNLIFYGKKHDLYKTDTIYIKMNKESNKI